MLSIKRKQSLDEEKLLNNENPLNAHKPFMSYSVTVSNHESQAGCTESSCALEECNKYFCATSFGGIDNQLIVPFEIFPNRSYAMKDWRIRQSQINQLFGMTNCSDADTDFQTATFAYGGIGEGLAFVVLAVIGILISVVFTCRWIHKRYKFCVER